MGRQINQQKKVVWQDIVPAKKPQKPIKKNGVLFIVRTPILFVKKSSIYIKTKKRLATIPRKQQVIGSVIFVVAIFLTFSCLSIWQPLRTASDTDSPNITTELVRGIPKFSTVLPSGKSIDNLGGWTRVSPASSDPVFAFTDKIDNIPIIVSQQTLPDGFQTNTSEQIRQLAESFNADEKISAGDDTIYIGTSTDGIQSVICSKDNLLILIKSNSRITNNSWVQYINSLH